MLAAAQKIPHGEMSDISRTYAPHAHNETGVPSSLLAMVDALDVDGIRELELVLEVLLAAPVDAPSERRETELGFLASLLELPEAMGRNSARSTPLQSFYDEHRPTGSPSGRRLGKRYGTWTKACRAARGYLDPELGAKPWTHDNVGRRATPHYDRDEVVRAVIACGAAIGRMPSSHAYYTWAAEQRRRAKKTGAVARYPAQRTVEDHVGYWAEVTRAVHEVLAA